MPFLYNLDASVEGLDVIDFPGVDDRDETIPDLAELLLALVQVVVFVVDYRYAVVIVYVLNLRACIHACVYSPLVYYCIACGTWSPEKSKRNTIWVKSCFHSSLIHL